MDLGIIFVYWIELKEVCFMFLVVVNFIWLFGNFNWQEVLDCYVQQWEIMIVNLVFYYVFGVFKIGVIVQQIYVCY